jgi:hypothetical protein
MGEAGRSTSAQTGGPDDTTRAEEAIDEVLVDSFPASDAPPWTLGIDSQSVYLDRSEEADATHSPLDGSFGDPG